MSDLLQDDASSSSQLYASLLAELSASATCEIAEKDLALALSGLQECIGAGRSLLDRLMHASLEKIKAEAKARSNLAKLFKPVQERILMGGKGKDQEGTKTKLVQDAETSLYCGKVVLACQSCYLALKRFCRFVGSINLIDDRWSPFKVWNIHSFTHSLCRAILSGMYSDILSNWLWHSVWQFECHTYLYGPYLSIWAMYSPCKTSNLRVVCSLCASLLSGRAASDNLEFRI